MKMDLTFESYHKNGRWGRLLYKGSVIITDVRQEAAEILINIEKQRNELSATLLGVQV